MEPDSLPTTHRIDLSPVKQSIYDKVCDELEKSPSPKKFDIKKEAERIA